LGIEVSAGTWWRVFAVDYDQVALVDTGLNFKVWNCLCCVFAAPKQRARQPRSVRRSLVEVAGELLVEPLKHSGPVAVAVNKQLLLQYAEADTSRDGPVGEMLRKLAGVRP
jgi:hypothetical protein